MRQPRWMNFRSMWRGVMTWRSWTVSAAAHWPHWMRALKTVPVVPVDDDQEAQTYRSVIVTRNDGVINDLPALVGKHLALVDGQSTSG